MENSKPLIAELLGSFVLLFFGGLTVIAGGNIIAIAFGFGMSLLVGLYAFGERSGGHFNPAVSLGALLDKRIDPATFGAYVISQIVGFLLAGLALLVASSQEQVAGTATIRANPDIVSSASAFLIEIILTAMFVAVILRVTKSESLWIDSAAGYSVLTSRRASCRSHDLGCISKPGPEPRLGRLW